MRKLSSLSQKTRLGAGLAVLIIFLLLNNIINQQNFKDIERSAMSIYEDRLLPSQYIFEIREYVFKGQLLQKSTDSDGKDKKMAAYQSAVTVLIEKYEQTLLTTKEKVDFTSLKSNLYQFFVKHDDASVQQASFENILEDLNSLLYIQSGEGHHLKTSMVSIVHHSILRSYLELCLLVAIGAFTLAIVGFSNRFLKAEFYQHPSLN